MNTYHIATLRGKTYAINASYFELLDELFYFYVKEKVGDPSDPILTAIFPKKSTIIYSIEYDVENEEDDDDYLEEDAKDEEDEENDYIKNI